MCRHFAGSLGVTESSTILALTAVTFDIAALELLMPLSVGGKIALAPPSVASDEVALARVLAETDPEVVQATPSGWRFILARGKDAVSGAVALCGGEALYRGLAAEIAGASRRLLNAYGPAETTVWSTEGTASGDDVSIGRPISNTDVFVVDVVGGLAPVGVVGELWISGRGVARGYLNRAELTAERFVVHSLGGVAERAYRTGDMVRWRGDGNLEFVGRIDGQVKIRGYRVEPGEVESVLSGHEDVAAAVVVARELAPGDVRLVGYCVPGRGRDVEGLDSSVLREWCARVLPDFMVPSVVMAVAGFPLTSNGKVDRSALPVPCWGRGEVGTMYVAPRSSVERTLADIWRTVLGVPRVGIDEGFFSLGGDSMAALQFVRLAREAGLDITTRDIFRLSTVRGLSALLSKDHMVGERLGIDGDSSLPKNVEARKRIVLVDRATRASVERMFRTPGDRRSPPERSDRHADSCADRD